jgi:hypothetical protein
MGQFQKKAQFFPIIILEQGPADKRKHDITPALIFWYANQNHGYYDSASL